MFLLLFNDRVTHCLLYDFVDNASNHNHSRFLLFFNNRLPRTPPPKSMGVTCSGLEKKDIEVINNNQIKIELNYFPFNRDTSLSVAPQQDSPNCIKTLIEQFPINVSKNANDFL